MLFRLVLEKERKNVISKRFFSLFFLVTSQFVPQNSEFLSIL